MHMANRAVIGSEINIFKDFEPRILVLIDV